MSRCLVLCGDGINCENETASALVAAGADVDIVHVTELLARGSLLEEYKLLAVPGGFSFGDELGAGQILALKLNQTLRAPLQKFVGDKKPIIGICNGFQVLVKLGLLPGKGRKAALGLNRSGKFINRWVSLKVLPKASKVWFSNFSKGEQINLPIRHKEGRLVCEGPLPENAIPLTYTEDVNGSDFSAAGLCDHTGLILGLMPHPEAATATILDPTRKPASSGLNIFSSAVSYIKETFPCR